MAQSKILLDSNSYFRLAKSIHPLLFNEFGSNNYCLYAAEELEVEFDRNKRLKQKFPWVDDDEFRKNRTKKLHIPRKEKKLIASTNDIIWNHSLGEPDISISRVDASILSTSHVLNIPTVTDDGDMRIIASDFDIEMIKTLELIDLMVKSGHISMDIVRQIMAYWEYISDKPTGCHKDYRRLFKEEPPK